MIARPRQWPPAAVVWAAFGAAAVIMIIRLPESLFRAEFWAEDGLFFSEALARGAGTIVETYMGYLIVGMRTVAYIETIVPVHLAPLVGNAVQIAVLAGAAAFALSPRMPWDRRTGLVIAVGVALLPASFEIVGTSSHLMWPATLWMALVPLTSEPGSRWGRIGETCGLAVAGLTGLGAILLLPLFVRGPRRRLVVVGVASLIQLGLLLLSDRPGGMRIDVAQLPYVVLLRVVVVPVLGPVIAETLAPPAVIALGLAIAAIVAYLLARHTPRSAWWIAHVMLVAPLAALVAAGYDSVLYADPDFAPRYFWLCGVALVVLIGTSRNRLLAASLATILCVGIAAQFRIPAAEEMGWAEQSGCIGGPVPCEVPVAPDSRWNVRWMP